MIVSCCAGCSNGYSAVLTGCVKLSLLAASGHSERKKKTFMHRWKNRREEESRSLVDAHTGRSMLNRRPLTIQKQTVLEAEWRYLFSKVDSHCMEFLPQAFSQSSKAGTQRRPSEESLHVLGWTFFQTVTESRCFGFVLHLPCQR